MAGSRIPLPTSNFLSAVRSCRPQTHATIRYRSGPPTRKRARLSTSFGRSQQESTYQRYGPAVSHELPPPDKPSEPYLPDEKTSSDVARSDAVELEIKPAERRKRDQEEEKEKDEQQKEAAKTSQQSSKSVTTESAVTGTNTPTEPSDTDSTSGIDPLQAQASPIPNIDDGPLPNRELDMVLSIPTPSELKGPDIDPNQHHHPHLEASPYEHHFDTYSLVQDLNKETSDPSNPDKTIQPFSPAQSITLMKSIRLMLAQNLSLAHTALVSKSDTENETYLFRAACSELKTTMLTSRSTEAQKQRSHRAQLQHEHDILSQKMTQDLGVMREDLKGMFNDRKLGLQEEKRQTDGKIQTLTYRISVDLNSEARSEVEGLRWVLTRRAALTIIISAAMVISFLQYVSIKTREAAEREKKRKARVQAETDLVRREQEGIGRNAGTGSGTYNVGSRSQGTQTDGIVLAGSAEGYEGLG